MPTALTLDLPKLAFMTLTEDGAQVPSSFSNVACSASDLSVFGFLSPLSGNILNLGIIGPGTASILIKADCNYTDRYTGKPGTTTKQKSIPLNVTGSAPGWTVVIGS